MVGTGLQGLKELGNTPSGGAALSPAESLATSKEFSLESGSQIYKQDKDFLLKETINLENKNQQDISDEWERFRCKELSVRRQRPLRAGGFVAGGIRLGVDYSTVRIPCSGEHVLFCESLSLSQSQ